MVLIPINYFPERENPPTASNLYIGRVALMPGKNQIDSEAWDSVKHHPMIVQRLDDHVIEPLGTVTIIEPTPKEVKVIANSVQPEVAQPEPIKPPAKFVVPATPKAETKKTSTASKDDSPKP